MKLGKLSNDKLDSLILSKFGHMRKEVVCSPHVGVDCAAVDLGGRIAVLSTDPITAADKNIGSLTVHVSCNDAAAAGAEPIGLLVTLLIPPHGTEEEVEHIAQELAEAAKLANIEIIGGHTEVTASVNRYVTCAAVIARAGKNGIITPAGMKAGQDIIMTKMAGIEGTAVIASDAAGRTGLTDAELEEARGFMSMVSVVKEGLYAAEHGATAMHDITEGGVFGAAWEMAEASGCGMVLYPEKVLMHPITKKICRKFGIDPYRLISSGSMLIACDDGEGMVKGLAAMGIPAAVIGKAVESGVSTADGTEIPAPEADELYKII